MSVYGSYTRIPNPTLINSLQNNTKDKSFRVCHEKIRVNKSTQEKGYYNSNVPRDGGLLGPLLSCF